MTLTLNGGAGSSTVFWQAIGDRRPHVLRHRCNRPRSSRRGPGGWYAKGKYGTKIGAIVTDVRQTMADAGNCSHSMNDIPNWVIALIAVIGSPLGADVGVRIAVTRLETRMQTVLNDMVRLWNKITNHEKAESGQQHGYGCWSPR